MNDVRLVKVSVLRSSIGASCCIALSRRASWCGQLSFDWMSRPRSKALRANNCSISAPTRIARYAISSSSACLFSAHWTQSVCLSAYTSPFSFTMEYTEDKSSTIKISAGFFAFDFSIEAVTLFLVWRCLGKWSHARARTPSTIFIRKELILLNLFREWPASQLKRVKLGPYYHIAWYYGDPHHHTNVRECLLFLPLLVDYLFFCRWYMQTQRSSVFRKAYWRYGPPIAGQHLGCNLRALFGLMVYSQMS